MACRPAPVEVLGEDPLHDRRRGRVGLEAVQRWPIGGLGRVGVRAGVDELVAVGRSAAEEAAFDRGLGGHRGADPDLDPVALALAHAAVERHDQVVGFGARVDRAADLGHPQLDAVVGEHREREPELVAVERALRLADHDGVEAAVRVAEGVEQPRGLGAALPRQRPGLADVEELGDDLAAGGLDDWRERASCQFRDDVGSCWSSVLTRP